MSIEAESPTKGRSSEDEGVQRDRQAEGQRERQVAKLESDDKFITAKMYEKLFELRTTLFPLLH